MRLNLLTACAVVAFSVSASGAYAATISSNICSTYVADSVTKTAGCELGSIGQDFLNPTLQVNDDKLFGQTDWNFIARDNAPFGTSESGDIGVGTNLFIDGAPTGSGTWAIAKALFQTYGNLLLVFKGGEGAVIEPDKYVGYLLDGSFFNGDYIHSPFINLNTQGQTGISHVSLYGRIGENNEPPPIPLPAGGLLLLTGLAGLGAASRRRKRK
ncbi:MAG: VPLPA-CTERM sorting domain-containing protein [Proteobacteria bacterium]|nr:VPLPA-CTERM sorting domain-containing protein [Pseudomonadota bacterium]